MTYHIGYIHGSRLESFSPPSFCCSGAALQEYTYYYQKGYRQITGKTFSPKQEPLQKSRCRKRHEKGRAQR